MLAQSYPVGRGNSPVSIMQNEQRAIIRKAVSDLSREMEKHKLNNKETDHQQEVTIMSSKVVEEEEQAEIIELQQAVCKCCGLKEECTKSYILEVQRSFSGKWLCGLCCEAVKEKVLKSPNTPIDKAVDFHKAFCDTFNTTTRLNPKLSFTSSMRKIARKSFENRNSKMLSRSVSCDPVSMTDHFVIEEL